MSMNRVVLRSSVRSSDVLPTPVGPTISILAPRGPVTRWSAAMILAVGVEASFMSSLPRVLTA